VRILREISGLGSRPYPLDHERRRRVLVSLAERNLTIGGLANALGLSISLMSMIINGRRLSPKTEQRIAKFLGKDAEYLFPQRMTAEIKKMREAEAKAKRRTA